MRVLVTGAAGTLGEVLAPELAGAGHDVRLFDMRPIKTSFDTVIGDLRDAAVIRTAVADIDAVVHTAALHGVHRPYWSAEDFWSINATGTWNVYTACQEAGVGRVVLASTMGVYGATPAPGSTRWVYVDDETPLALQRVYPMTKRVCEDIADFESRENGIRTVALRLGMFFPPRSFPRYGFRLLHGGVDVRDVAQAVLRSLEYEGERLFETFNVFADVPFSRTDLENLATDLAGTLDRFWPGVTDEVRRRGLDLGDLVTGRVVWRSDRARTELGYQPRYNFNEFFPAWRAGDTSSHLIFDHPRWGLPA